MKYAVIALLALIIGFLLRDCQGNDVITRTETKIEIDSTFYEYKEKYLIDSIHSIALTDSIDYYRKKYEQRLKDKNIVIVHDTIPVTDPVSVHLSRFSGFKPFLYGNIRYSGVVAGELLEIELENDFKLPIINNRITTTTINTINPKGLYLGAGINSLFEPSIGAAYLNKGLLFNYDYSPTVQGHQIGVKKKIF